MIQARDEIIPDDGPTWGRPSRLRDPSLLPSKPSERCAEARISSGSRQYRCILRTGHDTMHLTRYRAGLYRWQYERTWGAGPSPFLPLVMEEVVCPSCHGTGRVLQSKEDSA